jgi:hypothetical protein
MSADVAYRTGPSTTETVMTMTTTLGGRDRAIPTLF